MGRLNFYTFQHRKQDYNVEWSESDKILTLKFLKGGTELGTRDIKLLGVIDQKQLDQIVIDYWKSFVKKELKDIE